MKKTALTSNVSLTQFFYEMSVGTQNKGVHHPSKSKAHKEEKEYKKLKKEKKDKENKEAKE